MLDISFLELARSSAQQLFPQQVWCMVNQRHGILQLIAKTKRPTRLRETAAGVQASRNDLIRQPAIDEYVESWIRSFHLNRGQDFFPIIVHFSE